METELRIQCRKCKEIKPISKFIKYRKPQYGIKKICRDCRKKYRREIYLEEYPWYYSWEGAKLRCNFKSHKGYRYYGGRGIKMLLTLAEVGELWFRDKAYEMKRPSLDRINNRGHYIFENCRFIELPENVRRATLKHKELPKPM